MHPQNIEEVTAPVLQRLLIENRDDFILLDVREAHEYQFCNLGGRLIPLSELPNRLAELERDKTIIVHCRSGHRSQLALDILREAGFTKLKNFSGGILAWAKEVDQNFPVY